MLASGRIFSWMVEEDLGIVGPEAVCRLLSACGKEKGLNASLLATLAYRNR